MKNIVFTLLIACGAHASLAQSNAAASDNNVPIPQVTGDSKENGRRCTIKIDNCPILLFPNQINLNGTEADDVLVGQLSSSSPARPLNPNNCKIKKKYKYPGRMTLTFTYKEGMETISRTYQAYNKGALSYGALRYFINKDGIPVNFTEGILRITQNLGSNCNSRSKNIVVTCKQPIISMQPISGAFCSTAPTFKLSVAVSNSSSAGPISYQWQLNGQNLDIPSAKTANLELNDAKAGTYLCVITGKCSTVTSNPATLTSVNCAANIED